MSANHPLHSIGWLRFQAVASRFFSKGTELIELMIEHYKPDVALATEGGLVDLPRGIDGKIATREAAQCAYQTIFVNGPALPDLGSNIRYYYAAFQTQGFELRHWEDTIGISPMGTDRVFVFPGKTHLGILNKWSGCMEVIHESFPFVLCNVEEIRDFSPDVFKAFKGNTYPESYKKAVFDVLSAPKQESFTVSVGKSRLPKNE